MELVNRIRQLVHDRTFVDGCFVLVSRRCEHQIRLELNRSARDYITASYVDYTGQISIYGCNIRSCSSPATEAYILSERGVVNIFYLFLDASEERAFWSEVDRPREYDRRQVRASTQVQWSWV
jgi:hypothetical protein